MRRPSRWRQLDVNDIPDDATVGFFGPRGCGKTTAMCSIIAAKNLDRGAVFCPTPEAFQTYGTYCPLPYIYDNFDEVALERMLRFQKAAAYRLHQIWRYETAQLEIRAKELRAQKWEERMRKLHERALKRSWTNEQMDIAFEREIVDEELEEKRNADIRQQIARARKAELRKPYSMFLILDDLSSNKSAMRSETLRTLINNGRHFMVLLCIAVQFTVDFPAGCRGGLDWVVVFYDSLGPNLTRLFELIVGVFPTQSMFEQVLREACDNGGCLVVKKNVPTTRLEDVVFMYKPKPVHLSSSYFGSQGYEFTAQMFLDQDKFEAAVGAVREDDGSDAKTRVEAAAVGAKSRRKKVTVPEPFADEIKKQRKSHKKKTLMEPIEESMPPIDDEEEEDDPKKAARKERDARVKENVAKLRIRMRKLGQEAQAQAQAQSAADHHQ